MITKTNPLSENEKEFELICDKSGKVFKRTEKRSHSGADIEIEISTMETAFCDEEIVKFEVWMGDKLKTDCWCKHIADFIKG